MQIIRNKLGRFEKGSESPKYWLGKKKPHTEETKRKIGLTNSIVLKGKKYPNRKSPPPFTEEHRENMSKAGLGKKLSEEHKLKISKFNKGHFVSEETKRKISEKNKGRRWSEELRNRLSGKNAFNWRGGISYEPYSIDWTETLKRSIRERDKYTCRTCGLYGFVVHHINYDKKNCDPNNLITLCNSCHSKTNYNRNYWINYFKQILCR